MKRPISRREARVETRAIWGFIVVVLCLIAIAVYFYVTEGDQPPLPPQ